MPWTRLSQRREQKQALHEFALSVQTHAVDARGATTAAVAAAVRDVATAGWSIADVLHALTYDPTGQPYRTNGAGGMRRPADWIKIRLTAWTHDGTPIKSFSQQAITRRHEEQARQRAETERQKTQQARAITAPPRFREYARLLRTHGADVALAQFPEFDVKTSTCRND